MVVFEKTPRGQLIYDLCFEKLTDKWLARKHKVPLEVIRTYRTLKEIVSLTERVKKDRGVRHG